MVDDNSVPGPAETNGVTKSPSDFIRGWLATPAWLLGGIYTAGTIIVNQHLARYADVSGGLVQWRYISAGLLCLVILGFPLSTAVLTWIGAIDLTREDVHTVQSRRSRLSYWLLIFLVWTLIQCGAFWAWHKLVDLIMVAPDTSIEAVTFVAACATGLTGVLAAHSKRLAWHSTQSFKWRLSGVAYLGLLGTTLLITAMSLFARIWYPRVRPEYGGGAATAAAIVLSEPSLGAMLSLDTTGAVAIIGEYDGYTHVVACPRSPGRLQSIAIATSKVSAIRYLRLSDSSGNVLIILGDNACRKLTKIPLP